MGYLQDDKPSKNVISNEKVQVIDILDQKFQKSDNQLTESITSLTSSQDTFDIEGYVPDLQWTEEEEVQVVRAIDIKLMPFILLMTFVLNMDRTNNCKFYK
jgi:hypothetical protein